MHHRLIWDGEMSEEDSLKLEVTPFSEFQLFDASPFQIHRCSTDGGIVTHSQESLRLHGGHQVKQPVILTRREVELLVSGVIK